MVGNVLKGFNGGTLLIGLVMMVALTSCVTVNVNFPEGAVQKAADDYVRELYRAKESEEIPASEETSRIMTRTPLWAFWLSPTSAQATTPEFRTDSPAAKAIQAQQAQRINEITRFKKKGYIGENAKGLLEIRSTDMSPIEKKRVEKLVKAENNDREKLYREVRKSNKLSASYDDKIRASFARSFQFHSPQGTPIETNGSWQKKP